MGAYLSKPVTDKVTETGHGKGIKYAATCMQGWRISQEDDHNCMIDLEENWHMFAVYDGHGGSEVARYTAVNLPEFLKNKKFWVAPDVAKRLQELFVEFDDHLRSPTAMKELKKIAAEEKDQKDDTEETDGEDDAQDMQDRIKTVEESCIPLEQLLARYGYSFMSGSRFQSLQAECYEDGPASGNGKSKKGKRLCKSPVDDKEQDAKRPKTNGENSVKTEENGEQVDGDSKPSHSGDAISHDDDDTKKVDGSHQKDKDKNGHKASGEENVEAGNEAEKKSAKVVERQKKKPVFQEKSTPKEKNDTKGAILDSSSDEDDEDFEAASDEDEEEKVEDEQLEDEDQDDEEQDDEEQLEDEEDISSGEDDEEGYKGGPVGSLLSNDTPGEDSGTTACVCLINKDKIIVANAGDSRAVLCRDGKAIDLSIDHKPDDDIEKTRITKAGGSVNEDGRVNGGLNLSRALGDHAYKKNAELDLKEQMITALPDIKMETIGAKDEFLIVACDGIWNSLDSQQVVDYVRARLANGAKPEEICEQLCDSCLADSTQGDGTGCDNMTVVLALLNSNDTEIENKHEVAATAEATAEP